MSDTRLPAAAKHSAISVISAAHTRYAMGAAAPSRSATVAGIRKIDEAIVTLMMLERQLARPDRAHQLRVGGAC